MKPKDLASVLQLIAVVASLLAMALQVLVLLGPSYELLFSVVTVTLVLLLGIFSDQIVSAVKRLDRKQRVYLSYSADARYDARVVARRLRQSGIKVWLDEEQLLPGQSWRAATANAIGNSDKVVFIFGESRKDVSFELNLASEKALSIIPVVVKDTEIPSAIEDVSYIDLRFDPEEGFRKLTKALS